jgi:hypothetical protein
LEGWALGGLLLALGGDSGEAWGDERAKNMGRVGSTKELRKKKNKRVISRASLVLRGGEGQPRVFPWTTVDGTEKSGQRGRHA